MCKVLYDIDGTFGHVSPVFDTIQWEFGNVPVCGLTFSMLKRLPVEYCGCKGLVGNNLNIYAEHCILVFIFYAGNELMGQDVLDSTSESGGESDEDPSAFGPTAILRRRRVSALHAVLIEHPNSPLSRLVCLVCACCVLCSVCSVRFYLYSIAVKPD
jgi:hypothetical protein